MIRKQVYFIVPALALAAWFMSADVGQAGCHGGGGGGRYYRHRAYHAPSGGYKYPKGGYAQKYVKVDGYMVRRKPQRQIHLDPVVMAKRTDKRDYIKYFVPLQNGDLYTCYWYKEKSNDDKYRCHVYYYPQNDSKVYLYNPYEKVWYGRYDRDNKNYENLALSQQRAKLQDVDPAAWKGSAFPKIPNSYDGKAMKTPPQPPSIEIKKTRIKVVKH